MTILAWFFLWWASGVVSIAWLIWRETHRITRGDVVLISLNAIFCGAMVLLIVAYVSTKKSGWLDKPVFSRGT